MGGTTGIGGSAPLGTTTSLSPLHVTGTSLLDSKNIAVVLRGADTIDVGVAN